MRHMENKRYKKNFLSNVVFKLDFPTLSDYGPENLKRQKRLKLKLQKYQNGRFLIKQKQELFHLNLTILLWNLKNILILKIF